MKYTNVSQANLSPAVDRILGRGSITDQPIFAAWPYSFATTEINWCIVRCMYSHPMGDSIQKYAVNPFDWVEFTPLLDSSKDPRR